MGPPHHLLHTADQLGSILRSARKTRKLTQGDLAAKLNISQSRVSQLELQSGDLTVHQLLDWCAALSLEVKIGERAPLTTTRATPPALSNTPRKGSW